MSFVSLVLGAKSEKYKREKEDFYATPVENVIEILERVPLKGTILEPCCGQGHIVKALREMYEEDKIFSSDIVYRENAVCENHCQEIKDFLKDDFEKVDNIITNPPFKYAKDIVEKSLEIANDKVIMLLKIQFLESISRKEFLENSPLKYVYVYSKRVNTLRDGLTINPTNNKKWSSAFLFCWFVWEKGYEGEPIIRWI